MKNSDWDIDLRDGEAGESVVADLLSIDTVEVKTDRKWHSTGNIYIETACYYVATNTWEPSGVEVSKATHWAFVLHNSVLIIPLESLKRAIYEVGRQTRCNIEPNPSVGYLVTPAQLLESLRVFATNER